MADSIKLILRASWVGIIANALLALVKIIVGFITNSQAVIGDGLDTLADVATYVIILFMAKLSQRPPTARYPYGFRRAETIASKLLSFFIFFAGAQLLYNNIEQLVSQEPRELPGALAIYVTALSIVIKSLLAGWQFRIGRITGSGMLIANAKNMRSDIVLSLRHFCI